MPITRWAVREALQFFDQSLAINPGLHEALTYKGLISSNFGKHLEALALYDRALAVNASYAKTWYIKGLTLAILEQYDDAIRSYEQALAIEPKHVDALAGISMAMKKRERAKGSPSISVQVHGEDTYRRWRRQHEMFSCSSGHNLRGAQKIPVILSASYGKTAPVGQERNRH